MPWRNFLSPEFKTKFQREVPLFLDITEFPFNRVYRTGGRKLICQNPARFVSIEHRLVTDGHRRTDTGPRLLPRMHARCMLLQLSIKCVTAAAFYELPSSSLYTTVLLQRSAEHRRPFVSRIDINLTDGRTVNVQPMPNGCCCCCGCCW